ncbi:hypothetical protein [Pedobacter sp. ASV12]|uniref:hypothetical protein n=1 Tax=Pedobacter sp. ASV12 TaxID=2795120 RepID=UPI0018EC481E|nr:hypothetical protein [Pedobacter sp. ASV12]
MKNNLKKTGWALLIGLTFFACKKELVIKTQTVPLSKNTPDLSKRLATIRQQYYDQKMDARFVAKDDKGITWTPEWSNPKLQTVNDSVSYVFYQMIGTVKRDGKTVKVQEIGAATYLMVKNEKEFYKAFYSLADDKRNKNLSDDTSEVIMRHFTGRLLLSSLTGGRNYLLNYVNGSVSEAYQKNQNALRKLQSVGNTTSYWEQVCQTVIRHCTFVSAGYSLCGGEVMVIYSYNCYWPQPMCGVTFYMTDSSEETVCEQVWFDDPPNGGGSGGGDDGQTLSDYDLEDARLVDDGKKPIDPKKYIDCFNDGKQVQSYKMTLYINQPVPGTNAQFTTPLVSNGIGLTISKNGTFFDVGHSFVGFEKINRDGSSVRQVMGFYPDPNGSSIRSKGVIKDNSGHVYNVSYTQEVTEEQFGLALSSVLSDGNGAIYNLGNNIASGQEYNCTDAALLWMGNAGIKLPASTPRGLFNNTPGDYGQVLAKVSGAKSTSTNVSAPNGHGACN